MNTLVHEKLPIIVLISGNGSNLQAIIDAIAAEQLDAKLCAVISNKTDAFGLERARKADIPVEVLTQAQCPERSQYDHALAELIEKYQAKLIILAGFMRILGDDFVARYRGKILNIHPSLLPKYPGLKTHQKVLAAGDKKHGVSVHYVTEQLDGGPLIAQAQLDVLPEDNTESLQHRVHQLEHRLYPMVIQWIAADRLKYTADGIYLDGQYLAVPKNIS